MIKKIKSIDDPNVPSFNPLFHLRWELFLVDTSFFFDFIPLYSSILCVRVQTFVTRTILTPPENPQELPTLEWFARNYNLRQL